jgi:hypothetical protein
VEEVGPGVIGTGVIGALGEGSGLVVSAGLPVGWGLGDVPGPIVAPGSSEASTDGLTWAAAVGEADGNGLAGGDPPANTKNSNATIATPTTSRATSVAGRRQISLFISRCPPSSRQKMRQAGEVIQVRAIEPEKARPTEADRPYRSPW